MSPSKLTDIVCACCCLALAGSFFTKLRSHEKLEASDQRANFHRLLEPQIFDENASFVTKTFFIRYAEETVTLRHVVKFRTEVDV